jgi:hypothetical protein
VTTLCSAFKMHTVELRCSDEWMNEIHRGNEELRNEGRPGRPDRYETDAALRSILRDGPNGSLRTIADTSPMSMSPETVHTHISRAYLDTTVSTMRNPPKNANQPFIS